MTGLAGVGAALLAAALQAPLTVERLFDALSHERPRRATYHETRHLALLDRPVESSGELVFTPPARLEKRALAPRRESVVVDGDVLTLERNGRRQSLGLREQPALAMLVASIRATLAGDLAALTRDYSVALSGAPERWRLVVRPLDSSVATLVERVEIGGADTEVRTVEIFQADGDRSVMIIAPAR